MQVYKDCRNLHEHSHEFHHLDDLLHLYLYRESVAFLMQVFLDYCHLHKHFHEYKIRDLFKDLLLGRPFTAFLYKL